MFPMCTAHGTSDFDYDIEPYYYGKEKDMGLQSHPSHAIPSPEVEVTKDMFVVNLDVRKFNLDDISVSVTEDFLIIEGEHQVRRMSSGGERDDTATGPIPFKRRYFLPENSDKERLHYEIDPTNTLLVVTIPISTTNNGATSSSRIDHHQTHPMRKITTPSCFGGFGSCSKPLCD